MKLESMNREELIKILKENEKELKKAKILEDKNNELIDALKQKGDVLHKKDDALETRIQELVDRIKLKDEDTRRKDSAIENRNQELVNSIKQKEDEIQTKDKELGEKDKELGEKDDAIKKKDDAIKKKVDELREKDNTLKKKDDKLGRKDDIIAMKEASIGFYKTISEREVKKVLINENSSFKRRKRTNRGNTSSSSKGQGNSQQTQQEVVEYNGIRIKFGRRDFLIEFEEDYTALIILSKAKYFQSILESDIDAEESIVVKLYVDSDLVYVPYDSSVYQMYRAERDCINKLMEDPGYSNCYLKHSEEFVVADFYGNGRSYSGNVILSRYIKKEKDLKKISLRGIEQQLEIIHRNGIAHREINQENILYDYAQDKTYITDFALSIYTGDIEKWKEKDRKDLERLKEAHYDMIRPVFESE